MLNKNSVIITFLGLALSFGPVCGSLYADEIDPKLIEAAKKEGEVYYYHAQRRDIGQEIADAFTKKYGIKVYILRKGSGGIVQHVEAEQQAGIKRVDVADHAIPSMWKTWASQGKLMPYRPTAADKYTKLAAAAVDPDWKYHLVNLTVGTPCYITTRVSEQEVPKSWKDLLDPKWKDRLVLSDPDYSGTAVTIVASLWKAFGWDYFKQLGKNNLKLVQSSYAPPKMLLSGEADVAAFSIMSDILHRKSKGEPIDIIMPTDGICVVYGCNGIFKTAPHPNAAKLLVEFINAEGQQIFSDHFFYPIRADVPLPKGGPSLEDYKVLLTPWDYVAEHRKELSSKFHGCLEK